MMSKIQYIELETSSNH